MSVLCVLTHCPYNFCSVWVVECVPKWPIGHVVFIPSHVQNRLLNFRKNKTNCPKICLGGLIGLRTLNVRLESEMWLKMVLVAPWTRGRPSQRSSRQEWPSQRQSHLQQESADTSHLQVLILIWSNSHICNMTIYFAVQWPFEPWPWLGIVLY